jgi:hypothetical protein
MDGWIDGRSAVVDHDIVSFRSILFCSSSSICTQLIYSITARLINYGTVRYSKYLYQYGTVLLYLLDDSSLEMIIRFCSVCFTVLVLCAVVLITTQ